MEAEQTPDQGPAKPVAASSRIASLDFIRGIAVMGILWANIVAFGQPMTAYMYPDAFMTEHGKTSDWMWLVQFVLIDNKMRGLFTLLFGAGVMLFMQRVWARGDSGWLQARRLGWLAVFGLIHFFFIWRGDILFLYAGCGIVSLMFIGMKAKTQLVLGLLGYVAGAILFAAMFGAMAFAASGAAGDAAPMAEVVTNLEIGKQAEIDDGLLEAKLIQSGDYPGLVSHQLSQHAADPLVGLLLVFFETLPLMLIGMALYRMGLFGGSEGDGFDPVKQRLWGWIALIAGAAMSLPIGLWVLSGGLTYYDTLAAIIGFSAMPTLLMVLGFAALLSLYGSRTNGRIADRVSAAGRVAFTNYLGTSLVMMLVFHGWAGGLFGELGRPQLLLVAAATWVLMLAWSKPWLERFRYGPLEWLWRCLTYWRIFPLKK